MSIELKYCIPEYAQVLNNIYKYFDYHNKKYKKIDNANMLYNQKKLISIIENNNENYFGIMLINSGSDMTAAIFNNIFKNANKDDFAKNMIIICDIYIDKLYDKLSAMVESKIIDTFRIVNTIKFYICPFEIFCIPKHEIYENSDELIELLHIKSKKDLPVILKDDVSIIWLDAKPGDVIKIHRNSPIVGISYYYRIVQ